MSDLSWMSTEYARQLGVMLDQTATVYARSTSGADKGQYTVAVHTGLLCDLQPVSGIRSSSLSVSERTELANSGVLYFDPSYTMPEFSQVEVSSRPGERFTVQAGTIWPDVGPGGVITMKYCNVIRAAGRAT